MKLLLDGEEHLLVPIKRIGEIDFFFVRADRFEEIVEAIKGEGEDCISDLIDTKMLIHISEVCLDCEIDAGISESRLQTQ